MNNLIFIGGIHGAGKGKICDEITNNTDLFHLTASKVLKWNEISEIENKLVKNIKSNQDRLILNLKLIIDKEKRYLLDGHYCLLNENGKPEKVPFYTFVGIQPKKLIVVFEDPIIIKNRLESRDFKFYNEQLLKEFQDIEVEYAEEIASKLNIQLLKIKSTDFDLKKLKKFVQ